VILGIGVDMVDIRRMRTGIERFGERFAVKLLSDQELDEFRAAVDPAAFLAKRFAAKEALVKAMGMGFREGIQHRQISVAHTPAGQPRFNCQGKISVVLSEQGVSVCHLSITDEKNYAVAYVVLER
jgi:holo-[acyl-carrier protein] synthase